MLFDLQVCATSHRRRQDEIGKFFHVSCLFLSSAFILKNILLEAYTWSNKTLLMFVAIWLDSNIDSRCQQLPDIWSLAGRDCLFDVLVLNLSLRLTVRYPNCEFAGSRPLSNLRGRFWDRGCWVALDLQPFLHFLFVSPPLHFSILILGANCPTLFGLLRYLFDTLFKKRENKNCSPIGNRRNLLPFFSQVVYYTARDETTAGPKKKKTLPIAQFWPSNEFLHVVLASLCILSLQLNFVVELLSKRRNLQLTFRSHFLESNSFERLAP